MIGDTIPGTTIDFTEYDQTIAYIRQMIDFTGGLSLGQVCKLTGLPETSIQNWVKRGYVPHPERKRYYERHMSRILLISALKDSMNIEDIGELMVLINGDADDESDDIVSESELYRYLCKAIKGLDVEALAQNQIEYRIKAILAEDKANAEKLSMALKVMVYAYISGACFRRSDRYLQELKKM
ncbi:MAG: DUF1836 domain-containing protein [Erysipelotrichaceae bacterium]|nr:DUF1836 domain-containing protein [Erysipelotrichaceae bacterium]